MRTLDATRQTQHFPPVLGWRPGAESTLRSSPAGDLTSRGSTPVAPAGLCLRLPWPTLHLGSPARTPPVREVLARRCPSGPFFPRGKKLGAPPANAAPPGLSGLEAGVVEASQRAPCRLYAVGATPPPSGGLGSKAEGEKGTCPLPKKIWFRNEIC